DVSAPSQEGAALELESRCNAHLFWASSRRTAGVFARRRCFPGVPLRRNFGGRSYYRSLRREGVLRLETRLAKNAPAIQRRAWIRPLPSAEDVVMLKPAMNWRTS